MSSSPSYERVNYLLRPNKSVERKIVFDRLTSLSAAIPFAGHRYLGFGGIWFVDFVMAHRQLKIKDLLSIEHAEGAARAEFNKPYSTVKVLSGEATEILGDMNEEEWRRPQIAWLDYDGCLTQDVASDLALLLSRVAPYSILLATVNGVRDSYRPMVPGGGAKVPAKKTLTDLFSEDVLPTGYKFVGAGANTDVSKNDFPSFLADALLNFIRRKLRLIGRQEGEGAVSFIPLFNFCHADGAEMVTIGGILLPTNKISELKTTLENSGGIVDGASNPPQLQLDLAQLTAKEKIELDRLLPCDEEPFLTQAHEKGLSLSDAQCAKYRNYYLYFPVFSETFF